MPTAMASIVVVVVAFAMDMIDKTRNCRRPCAEARVHIIVMSSKVLWTEAWRIAFKTDLLPLVELVLEGV